MAAALPPLPQPTGIFTQFITRQTETIIVDEKGLSLSGDSYRVNLANGAPILKVQGNFFSMRGRKQVFDLKDNHLFTVRTRASSLLHVRYLAQSPAEEILMEVKFSASKFIGSRAYITFTSSSGKAESFSMEGDWRTKRAQITDDVTGATVARIERHSSAKHYLADAPTYTVTIAPNMDMALAMAMCICLDEKKESGSGSNAWV